MRSINLVLTLLASFSTVALCGKKKNSAQTTIPPQSDLATPKKVQCELIAEMRRHFNDLHVPFRKFCDFFFSGGCRIHVKRENGSVSSSLEPTVTANVYIMKFFPDIVSETDRLQSYLSEVESMCQGAASIEQLHEVSKRSFTIAQNGQVLVSKIRGDLTGLDKMLRGIDRPNIVSMKIRGMISLGDHEATWERFAERQGRLFFETGRALDNFVKAASPQEQTSISTPETALAEEAECNTSAPVDEAKTALEVPSGETGLLPSTGHPCNHATGSQNESKQDVEVETSTTTPIPPSKGISWADEWEEEYLTTSTISPTPTQPPATQPRVNVWELRKAARATPNTATPTQEPATSNTVTPTEEPIITEGRWVQVNRKTKSSGKPTFPRRS